MASTRSSYMPAGKAQQIAWATQFRDIIGPGFAAYGVSDEQAASFVDVVGELVTAWNTSQDPATRTKVTVNVRDVLMASMRAKARAIVSVIQGTPSVTDAMKIAAGITVRDEHPSPKPIPQEKPTVKVVKVDGRNVTVELLTAENKRAKPADVVQAILYTHVGPTEPTTIEQWICQGVVTRTTVEIPFAASPTGETGWITAYWTNAKGQSGPTADPIKVNLPASAVLPTTLKGAGTDEERTMRVAA